MSVDLLQYFLSDRIDCLFFQGRLHQSAQRSTKRAQRVYRELRFESETKAGRKKLRKCSGVGINLGIGDQEKERSFRFWLDFCWMCATLRLEAHHSWPLSSLPVRFTRP